jgi:formylglycine-generating enzyme required for sulfatase activity
MDLPEIRGLPPGTVTLHDARRGEHRIVQLEAFEIGVLAVTEEQFAELLGIPASHPRRPARDLSWQRAIRFCNAASEWEYACRAGSTGPHYGPLAEVAWTALDGVDHPQDVGMKLPNLNGLFDTLGNVWEWCWDFLDVERYDDYRVFRGGGFADDAWSVRASVRRGGGPRMHHDDVGMRLARGGFDAVDAAQGWSAQADAERSGRGGAHPVGWTPRR